ncbi:hypothetical protein BaRGS_00023530 [Batillaria attramentaria]|uniref:Uncharacterized protein n=1 Tax=Batillaria attramentaria TaxID=370345 RepID=A0ABD0KDT8_9CAEN
MPRFQSVDYYQRKLLRTRELYTNASLTVPCHFNDSGNPSEAPSKTRSLHELLSDLKEEDVEDFAEEPDFYLNGSRIKDGEWSVEQLDWLTAWRELEGHYVEIVPSSNPESHSSFIDDAPITGSLAEFCYVEDFMPQPLETLCQGERWMLEEPIKVCVESQNDPDSPTTSIKSCLDQATVIDSENPISVDQQISETTVFGTGDQQLDVDNEAEPCMLKDMMTGKSFHEEEELHEFQETRGEELLSPVCHHQSPPPSSPVESHLLSSLLEQSKSVCAQLSTSLAIPDCKEKGPELPDISEVFEGWSDERPRLQGLLLSPTVQEDVTSFVAINEAYKDGSPVTQHEQNVLEKCELESPMECCEIASPVCLADKCKAEAVNLTEWSPDVLTSHSLYVHVCIRVHLPPPEPDVVQEKEATTAGKPIEKALHLAVSHDTNASFGQLELNLSWNLSPAVPLLSLSIPEALQFSGDETQQPLPAFDPRDLSCCFESETTESDTQDKSPRMLQRLLTDTSKRARVVAESKSEKSSEQIRQEHRVAAFKKDQSWSSTEEKSKATHFGSTQRGHPFEKFIMKNDVPLDVQSPSKFSAQKGLIAAGGQRSHVGPVTSHVTSARPTAATRSAANRTFDNLDSPLTITEAKRAALVSTTNGDNQLNSTDNCADRESLSQEGNVPFDAFDLQFDEDEIVLDSDSLEEKGSQALSEKSVQGSVTDHRPVLFYVTLRVIKVMKGVCYNDDSEY